MPASVLVGTQWGDEGKGKVTDLISGDFDVVCRYAGGANAGHTVVAGGHKLALHQVPSGVMYKGVYPVIGNGCIVDPEILLGEIDTLEKQGISCDALKISGNAHIVMPYHKDLDGAHEKKLGKNLIGTTKRGVGPCYMDKMNRTGLRIQDMLDEHIFREKLESALAYTNPILEKVYELPTYTVDQICETYLPYAERIRPYIVESSLFLNEQLEAGKNILFEGAQATMLDIDHGTYPFVTSSNCTAGGAVTGSGVGPTQIDRVLGVAKAYLTRVGSGPFPTELFDETGDLLGEAGLRDAAGLEVRHLRCPQLLPAAARGKGLHRLPRAACRRPCLHHHGGPGPRADNRSLLEVASAKQAGKVPGSCAWHLRSLEGGP